MVIVTAVMIWLVIMCARRKSEGKDLTKASNIVSMPEVRKFKLDLSGKQQEEVDVDLDMQFDDVGIGNEVPITTNASPQLVSNNVLQVIVKKTKGKSERCKKDDKEESTQSSLERQRMSRKNVHSQSGSRIMKDLQEKQWEEPIGGIEVSFFLSHYHLYILISSRILRYYITNAITQMLT
ncbi:unnamed protein product [Acanthocheilonema viteae]|uniref:Uncharacterized protein n=1 Tax=Acanthocheilonema viteae TaxID=6277 RepID=A0A498SNY5_ACAVI|nr:unnamed protein product [Acanthocheilonema viteae]